MLQNNGLPKAALIEGKPQEITDDQPDIKNDDLESLQSARISRSSNISKNSNNSVRKRAPLETAKL